VAASHSLFRSTLDWPAFLLALWAVQSFLLASVAARPWFVPTKVWSNSTSFQVGRRSFNYTAILESAKAKEEVKRRSVRRSLDTTIVDLRPNATNITVSTTVHVPRSLTTALPNASNATTKLARSLAAYNATANVTRPVEHTKTTTRKSSTKRDWMGRLLHIRRAIELSHWSNSTTNHATRTLVPRSLSSGTVHAHAARSLSTGSAVPQPLSSGTAHSHVHTARSLSNGTLFQARSVNSTAKLTVRRSMKASHWTNSTSA